MPERQRKNIPHNTDDLEVKIKDLDYTNELRKLNIISSLASPYPIFEFVIDVDPDDITLEGVFGEDPIKLNIRSVGDDGQVQEEVDVKLMLLDNDQSISAGSSKSSDQNKTRSAFKFMAIPVQSFKTITTNVNEVYLNTTIKKVLENLIKSNTNAKPEIDEDGINNTPLEQVVIPPSILYRIIKEKTQKSKLDGYLDNQFGLYNGIPSVYCTYDNKVKIINLTRQIKKNHVLNIYQLSEDEDNKKIYDKSSSGGTVYTHGEVKSSYSGNTKFSSISKNINYITKPTDGLYRIIEKDLDDIISTYGIIDRNKNIQKNRELNTRKRYSIYHTGNDNSDTFAISDLSSMIGSLSSLELSIYGNFFVEEFLNIGTVAKFNPSSVEQVDLQGKYILFSTNIKYSRKTTEWDKSCDLRLIRSNKTN